MKKNDHYVSTLCLLSVWVYGKNKSSLVLTYFQFPMSEYIKDSTTASGWHIISHDTQLGVASDASNLNPDAMEEVAEGGSDIEPDVE